jgi:D-alanyl-D-alanine carboxypeptidase (penicillin-binding protein 5/6)
MRKRFFRLTAAAAAAAFSCAAAEASAPRRPELTAKAAYVVDASGRVLYSKNPHLRLPPASTTKVMTALLALERLPLDRKVRVSRRAVAAEPSKAGLTPGAEYRARDLVIAVLVASSNDASIALAEAMAGSEAAFAEMMNRRAAALGMKDTRFVNASGLPEKGKTQYSTAHDLTLLMRAALRDAHVDLILGITEAQITGSDGKRLSLRSHNKMLWKTPGFVKGKTGWTFASRHTFVGTNYESRKKIAFAMLSSKTPWTDIEGLARFGLLSVARR